MVELDCSRYKQCFDEAHQGFEEPLAKDKGLTKDDRIHGSLLVAQVRHRNHCHDLILTPVDDFHVLIDVVFRFFFLLSMAGAAAVLERRGRALAGATGTAQHVALANGAGLADVDHVARPAQRRRRAHQHAAGFAYFPFGISHFFSAASPLPPTPTC